MLPLKIFLSYNYWNYFKHLLKCNTWTFNYIHMCVQYLKGPEEVIDTLDRHRVNNPRPSWLRPCTRPFLLHEYEWWWAVKVDFWGLSSLCQALFYSSPAPWPRRAPVLTNHFWLRQISVSQPLNLAYSSFCRKYYVLLPHASFLPARLPVRQTEARHKKMSACFKWLITDNWWMERCKSVLWVIRRMFNGYKWPGLKETSW